MDRLSELKHPPMIGALSQPVQCVDFRGDLEVQQISEETAAKSKEPVIKNFAVIQVQLCSRQFHFPFHCYEGQLSTVILGNDFMYISGISPHIQSAKLLFLTKSDQLKNQVFTNNLEKEGCQDNWELVSYQYIKRLQCPRGKQGLPIISDTKIYRLPTICSIKDRLQQKENKQKQCRKEDGIDLAEHEHLIYPAIQMTIPSNETVEVPTTTKFFRLQKGIKYEFLALTRAPFYDIWFCPGINLNESGQGEHSMKFEMASSLGVILYPSIPIAIVRRAVEYKAIKLPVSLIELREEAEPVHINTVENSSLPMQIDAVESVPKEKYPEVSAFQPEPYLDFPFPNKDGIWPSVDDWTQKEIDEAAPEYDKWVVEEQGTFYLTPKPKVKLLNSHPNLQRGQRVLISKMISLLPEGMWNSENPDHLPGVPMTDVVIRVYLTHDKPICAKLRHLSETERIIAAREIGKWVSLGIYEPARSGYSCNLTLVQKKDSKEVRVCINFTQINNITVKDRYPLPNMENLLSYIAGSEYLTSTDVRLGFHNFFIHPEDRHKLAFSSPTGHWQPIRLPFGWCNGPSAFMRQMNVTHQNMQDAVLMFLDDAVIRTPPGTKNLKQHVMQFITIAANDHRRGLVYEDKKGQIVCQKIKLLGFTADGEGISPTWKPDLFKRLLERPYYSVADLQSTIGSLQWLKRFVPSFASIIRPLYLQVQRGLRLGEEKIVFNDECTNAIKKIEGYITALPKLNHADVEKAKIIYIVIGQSTFASSIWQEKEESKGLALVAFWSKVWPLHVGSYSSAECYALAIREILKFYAYLLVGVPKITFFTSNAEFTAMAQDHTLWSDRVARCLVATWKHTCSFRLSQDPLCKELKQLADHIPEDEETVAVTPLEVLIAKQPFGCAYNDERLLLLPMVFIDGAYSKVQKDGSEGAWACYWRKNSAYNASGRCLYPPFTNNRSEIEALLHTIDIRNSMTDVNIPWIAVSDSAYLCNTVNLHRNNWKEVSLPNEETRTFVGPQGMDVLNSDLWVKLFDKLKNTNVYVTHVRRTYTDKPDSMAKLILSNRKMQLTEERKKDQQSSAGEVLEVSRMTTRSMTKELNEENFRDLEESDGDLEEDTIFNEEVQWMESEDVDRNHDLVAEDSDFFLPTKEEYVLPNWNKNLVPTEKINKSLPIRFRLEEPQLNKFAGLMAALPTLQQEDAYCSTIINYLKGSAEALPMEIDRIVHRFTLEPVTSALVHSNRIQQKRFVVPESIQEIVISLFHKAAALGSHNSYEPTMAHVQRYFWWSNMGRQIKSYCRECTVCIAAKAPTGKPPGFLTPAPLPKGPWYKVHADTIRGLPTSYNVSNVLILQCSYSKFILAAPMRNLSSASSIDALTIWFTIFGPPQLFVADRGGEFNSSALTAFFYLWGVVPRFSEAYNPQANGQAEAAVKIVSRKLYTALYEYHRHQPASMSYKSWLLYLPYVVMAYNCTPNRITGFSPYEIMFGRPCTFPLPAPEKSIPVANESTLWDYLTQTQNSIYLARQVINVRLERRRQQIKRIFDRFRSPLTIDVGDYVFIYYPKTFKLHKLHPKAYGPYPVTHVSRLPGTREPVGVTVNLNTTECPVLKRFARGRVHPFRYVHRDINWAKFLDYSNQFQGGNFPGNELTTEEILSSERIERAMDLTTTRPLAAISLTSRFELSLVDWEEAIVCAELRAYTHPRNSYNLFEPVTETLEDLMALPVEYPSCNEAF